MIHNAIYIGRWLCDFFFAEEGDTESRATRLIEKCGAPELIARRASEILRSGRMNYGLTVSRPNILYSAVLIGPTTSGAEFLDTFVHEVRHLANDIADYLGYDLRAEQPAYLSGDLAREFAGVICRLGCEKCRL